MLQRFKKPLAAICVFALVLGALPQTVSAAATPSWSKVYTTLYENTAKNGIYTYTVKGLTKGQTVNWSLSGTGQQYATLAQTSTKATAKKVSNTVTIRTNGELYAKNKLINVTARVYDKKGKLKTTLTSGNAKIKIQPTAIEIVSPDLPNRLVIGTTYQFNYRITPANSTSANSWSASFLDGTDASECITSAGMFTPKKEGTYIITVRAKIGAKILATDSMTVTASTTLMETKQVAIDKLVATYSGDARTLVTKESFTLKNSYGLPELIKEIAFSEDGTAVTITTYSTFRSDEVYTLTDGTTSKTFTPQIGKPARLELTTKTVTVNKLTTLEYAIYDANGIDVTSVYPGTLTCNAQIINGYMQPNTNQITMYTVGEKGIIHMVLTFQDLSMVPLQAQDTVTCIAAVPSGEESFTLTDLPTAPDYSAVSYKDNRTIVEGKRCFLHFRALDTGNEAIAYDSITYTSSDPDSLLINGNEAIALKAGTVTVLVTARYGTQTSTSSFVVTITPPPYLTGLSSDRTQLYVSNRYPHKQYINLTAYNQYSQSFDLTDETAQFTDNNANQQPGLVSYDPADNRIEVTPYNCPAGAYYYTLTLTANGRSASVSFSVIVQTPPENGTVTYQIDIDNPLLYLAPSSDTNLATFVNDKTITIRLAEYRSGIFYRYGEIQYVRIRKDGLYYTSDLTQAPTANEYAIPAIDPLLDPKVVLNTVSLNPSNSVYSKAAVGTYSVEVWFLPQSTTANPNPSSVYQYSSFELRDSQITPTVNVARISPSAFCGTALALAQNCLSVSNGEIVECVAISTKENTVVNAYYSLQPGESIHIRSITVRISTTIANGQILSFDVPIDVGRTLTNL